MADKFFLLHPDDYDRAKTEGLPVEGGSSTLSGDFGIPLVRDNFGVCKPGLGFVVDDLQSELVCRTQVPAKLLFSDISLSAEYFSYHSLRLPDYKKFIVGVDWATGTVRRVPHLLSLKKRAKAQRRLDFSSNERRRKRWAELRARKR